MSNFTEQLQQIKTLISSESNSDKSFGYTSLQQLQEQASNDKFLIQELVYSSGAILSSITADIRVDDADEEIVALALKCLGFMIYHPSIVEAIPEQCVGEILESLARLILTTKTKAICNLGVWCISIQQLGASSLVRHFDSLLRSVAHALDNPAGSLSTTFEAVQAVNKLATQISEKMSDSSSIWAPPIYRRLLSADKRERDMSQRCLLKVKCIIFPPKLALSKIESLILPEKFKTAEKFFLKAIARDMKLSIIPAMKEMLKQGKKVQALQAWGWFIRILGYHSLKSKQLVNELLKVPEQTFSDPDAQVQIATLVAWEGLIDALVGFSLDSCDNVTMHHLHRKDDELDSNISSEVNGGIIQKRGYIKGLNLILTPVIGIMSSKADLSVQTSCLNAWCYLLHKLDSLVNDAHIIGTVVEPMFKVVLNTGLNDINTLIWSFCMEILYDFVKAKSLSANHGSGSDGIGKLLPGTTDSNSTWKTYSVKWLPWDNSHMDFLIRMMQIVFSQAAVATLTSQNKNLVFAGLLRLFRFVLKGAHSDLGRVSTSYDTVMQSMKSILVFVKTVCEGAFSVDCNSVDYQLACLQSLEVVTQELDSSILGSPLYKVPLDLKYVCQGEARCKTLMGSLPISSLDTVLPMTYLTVLYYLVVLSMSANAVNHNSTLQEAYTYSKSLLSSYDSLEILHAINTSMYVCISSSSLSVWKTVAQCLKDHMYSAKDLLPLNIQPGSTGSETVRYFLNFPIVVYSSYESITSKHCNSSTSPNFLDKSTGEVSEAWMSFYSLLNCTILPECLEKNSFAEDLCSSLSDFLHRSDSSERITETNTSSSSCGHQLLALCSDIAKCILENVHIEKVTPEALKSGYAGSSGINNCLDFVARLMNFCTKISEAPVTPAISRLLPSLTHMVGRLQWKEDITLVTKVLFGPLLIWMTDPVMNCESVKPQLQLLWVEIIRSLQRSWPAIEFDSSFLKLQAPLLEKALDHPNPCISEPTVNFWNSAYGDQMHLDFPACLLPVLDRLSRQGKLKIQQRRPPAPEKNGVNSRAVDDPPRHRVMATLSACSKRVELVNNGKISSPHKTELPLCPKRKRSELTEHQKEVRRAQQGKARDCSGHGPGIRTYTSLDFSQGNEDSQDSQDIRDPELILQLLKRAG